MSLRDRVRGRSLPTETVRFPSDRAAWSAAHAELEDAAAAVQVALRRGPASDEQLARRQLAQERVDGLAVHEYRVRALLPADWELLVAAHPAVRDEDQQDGFDPVTFWPALLAEAVTDEAGDTSTAEEWAEMFAAGEFSAAEKNTLTGAAWRLNATAWVVPDSVGKGSPPTPS